MNNLQKKNKSLLKILAIIGGVLILGLIGAVVYFYALADTDKEVSTTQIACGCYMIDPNVINDCGDPKRAFMFNINKVSSDQTCNAVCDTNALSENLLNSSTPKDSYKSCTVRSISDTRCENMILKDGNGKIITGKITPNDEINAEATFDQSTYTNYIFKVNSNTVTPDQIDGNKITKKITELGDADSIEILATAVDSTGDSINSIICRRVIDIEKEGSTDVNRLQIATEKNTDNTTKLSKVTITVGALQSEEVQVKFSFDKDIPAITAEKGLTVEAAKGVITMDSVDLYDSTNFNSSRDFSVLNDTFGDVAITAEVYVGSAKLGTASTSITLSEATDTGKEEPVPDEDPKSSFTVTTEITQECVERVPTDNVVNIKITAKNNLTTPDTLTSIKDKLPLGFTYTLNSSTVNGDGVEDSTLVTVTDVGDTQEVVWEPATEWTVSSGGSVIITFEATADENALTGDNMNEVIANPTQIPEDPSTLRAQADISVQQDCSDPVETPTTPSVPQTGILDSTIARVILGLIVIATGWFVYTRPEGTKLSQMIVSSTAYKDIELTKYRFTNPKKYFEEKILREKSKEN